ncbi:phosphotransferase enzyme family protein [Aspergillus costaricaensis CBS 115574]|uniref:Phosphotransferase enzyme family protein n=1 Tax=Aspergillus costaricaensis CBS 115574 TaxID=1448317 RepID=A0ACD1IGJ0_9EURO|nr:phosphotransferase enzyme family protein [Aspergillus costaricaensis CBS 115574]RAK89708.1 phosphotransferase enzyme family protein [Aspergillus costaricaensis CBS 115574]
MDWDHLAEEHNDKLFAGWLQLLSQQSPALPSRLATQHRRGTARVADVSQFTTGAYNICCIVTFEDGFRALVRFPILGRSRFRTEKSRNEASVMKFLSQNTALPVPRILGMGRWGCGPYLVITFIEGMLLSNRLGDPAIQSPSLNPNVSDSDIQSAYRVMAQVILELSKPIFSSIGALQEGFQMWKVAQRPLTLNMNELVRVGNLPPGIFAEGTFSTAGDYFEELARQQLLHLQYQRNDAVDDEQDCRKKYIARCLFRKIAREYNKQQSGPFHLYCDDLRPSNVLVAEQDFSLTGVIDWEFTYVAPAEFTYTAPWWLLFESPEAWESDLHVFLARYTPRLHLFVNALRSCEDEMIRKGALKEYQRLSERMAESLNNGLFWFCLAARKSYMFDDIYWQFLDKRHFGQGSLEDRLSLLSQEELDGLEMFVSLKMQQARENRLDEHMSIDKLIDL